MHRKHDRTAVPFSGRGTRNPLVRLLAVLLASASVMGGECDPKGPDFFDPIGPGQGDIVGEVTVDGVGRSGVTVTLTRNGQPIRTTTTGGNGSYEFLVLDPGAYTVSISSIPGAQCPGPQTANVPSGGRAVVDFPCTSLPTTGTVTGRVFDEDGGGGIAGAEVALNGRTTTTDSNGTFTFEMVEPGTHGVQATVNDFTCAARTTMVTAGQTSTVDVPCSRAVPTGTQIAGGYRLDGVGAENTCPTGNPFPNPGETVTNPGPIEVRSEVSNGQTSVTIVSNTEMQGTLNTATGEWTGMGTEPLSSSLDLWETTTGGRWQFDPSGNVIYDSGAELRFEVIDNMGTSDPDDDVEFCRAVIGSVQFTRLGAFVPSSARYKRDVRALLPEGATVLGLRPVVFRYRAAWGDPAVPRVGLIAEEVARIYPEAVAVDRGGEAMGIHYGILRGLLIEEVAARAARAVTAGIARLAEAY